MCTSETDHVQDYREQIDPAYQRVREAQEAFEESLTHASETDPELRPGDPESLETMASVAASASAFIRVANQLVDVIDTADTPEQCREYSRTLKTLTTVYIEGMEAALEGLNYLVGDTSDTKEWEFKIQRLRVESDQLSSELIPAELDCLY